MQTVSYALLECNGINHDPPSLMYVYKPDEHKVLPTGFIPTQNNYLKRRLYTVHNAIPSLSS